MKRRLIIAVVVVALLAVVGGFIIKKNQHGSSGNTQVTTDTTGQNPAKNNPYSQYSQGKCQGSGPVEFTYSPMKPEDVGSVQPYGIMVGAHVIPTDHGYFSPIIFNSPRDAYPVYAIADGYIVRASHRGQSVGDGPKSASDEYQLLVEYTCTFYSYYDLLTSLVGDVADKVGKLEGFETKEVRIPIKAGQEIGRIGGQTVDFGVWNFELAPAKVANPDSYQDHMDRLYLDDMYKYFAEPVKSQLLALSARVVEPKSGTIHYDIDGKLVGNWFRQGSNGFTGLVQKPAEAGNRYWDGHLAIAYDYIDPSMIKFSIGNYQGEATQFAVKGNAPDPKDVSIETGLIKYELVQASYINGDTGAQWMLAPPIANPKLKAESQVQGTVLIQMTEAKKLKLELFPNQTASEVTDFTAKAQIYER
ncbi:MAG: hypothetical protein Q8Q05_02575 [bacterium]|nr:hypothetical protein [bacterium]